MMILSWFENLPKDEQPPKKIWHDDRAIERHFAKIRGKKERSSAGYDEAEEGSLKDAQQGRDVTLTNKLVDELLSAQTSVNDDFSEI